MPVFSDRFSDRQWEAACREKRLEEAAAMLPELAQFDGKGYNVSCHPRLSYEEGVLDALRWVLGDTDEAPTLL